MWGLILGAAKWAAVGFVVAFFLMKIYEGTHIHDDVPRPDFKVRRARRAALVRGTSNSLTASHGGRVSNQDGVRDCRAPCVRDHGRL